MLSKLRAENHQLDELLNAHAQYTNVSLTRKVMRNLIVILVLFVTTLAVHAEDFNWRTGDGAKAPNTKNQKSISGFGGWWLVTPDKDWEEKWNTPKENIPHFSEAEEVELGEEN